MECVKRQDEGMRNGFTRRVYVLVTSMTSASSRTSSGTDRLASAEFKGGYMHSSAGCAFRSGLDVDKTVDGAASRSCARVLWGERKVSCEVLIQVNN